VQLPGAAYEARVRCTHDTSRSRHGGCQDTLNVDWAVAASDPHACVCLPSNDTCNSVVFAVIKEGPRAGQLEKYSEYGKLLGGISLPGAMFSCLCAVGQEVWVGCEDGRVRVISRGEPLARGNTIALLPLSEHACWHDDNLCSSLCMDNDATYRRLRGDHLVAWYLGAS
jgi:hypothetical protein